jgi:hypothetical protein
VDGNLFGIGAESGAKNAVAELEGGAGAGARSVDDDAGELEPEREGRLDMATVVLVLSAGLEEMMLGVSGRLTMEKDGNLHKECRQS